MTNTTLDNPDQGTIAAKPSLLTWVAGPADRRARRALLWAMVGLIAVLMVTGSIGRVSATDSVLGAVSAVLLGVIAPAVLLLLALGLALFARWSTPSFVEEAPVSEVLSPWVVGAVASLTVFGWTLWFIGQPIDAFAELGGVGEPHGWVFPFVVEGAFVLCALGFLLVGVADTVNAIKRDQTESNEVVSA